MTRGLKPHAAATGLGTMSAAVFRNFGPPSVLRYETDFPKPSRRPGEILIKVAAASVNPVDWKTRKGDVPRFTVTRPKIPGGDVAGVVVTADDNSKFKPGTYAEYAVAHESTILPIPEGFSFSQAAAVPLAAMTAYQAMQPSMPLAGKRVLVHAGAGGVGHYAIQIAKAQGAFVATTCGSRNAEFVTRELGADQAIDYKKEKFEEVSKEPYDVIVDLVGGDYEIRSMKILQTKGGHYANVINGGFINQKGFLLGTAATAYHMTKGILLGALGLGPKYTVVVMKHHKHLGLTQVAELMQQGKFKVSIDKEVPLPEAAKAHELSEEGHVRGKVVINVANL
eukprot:GHRR01006266.1.p1 GENE.GHRR01006266.1~~GHRR01006266.1.p1  ORF type:complete len:338 (+),score=95.80 GHRR01006266.1:261-1274(+)